MKRELDVLPHRGHCVAMQIGADERGLPLEALIVRTLDGELRAYANVCKHIPIPIDSGSGEYITEENGLPYLLCGTHGALYRLEDGLCVAGPCRGEHLDAIELVQEGTNTWLLEAEPDTD